MKFISLFLLIFISLSFDCFSLADENGSYFIAQERAKGLLSKGGRVRVRRHARELGPNEIHSKPWFWTTIPYFKYFFKELREVKKYRGAWYKKPDNLKLDYMPNKNEFQNRIIAQGKGHLDLVDMVLHELRHHPPDDDFMTIYWRYGQCLRNVDPVRNCPDPCNDPNACKGIPHVFDGRCRSVVDHSIKVDIAPAHKDFWQRIFQKRADCFCKRGFKWDHRKRRCYDVVDDCVGVLSGGNPCKNGGTCYQTRGHDAAKGYKCDCMPAYTGNSCQLPRDPCRGKHVCGRFRCKRDPANWKLGYTCMCNEKPGFERFSVEMPNCVDIDECKQTPCINGGKCNNTAGSYVCDCPEGWVGKHCENRNRVAAAWLEWGPFGTCSMTCGLDGKQVAYRKCNKPGACVGTNSRRRKCRDVPRYCEKEAVFDDSFGLMKTRGAHAGIYGAVGGPINVMNLNQVPKPAEEEPETYFNSEEDVEALVETLEGEEEPEEQQFPDKMDDSPNPHVPPPPPPPPPPGGAAGVGGVNSKITPDSSTGSRPQSPAGVMLLVALGACAILLGI